MANTKNLWWGYLHTNGKLLVKRYFSPMDIEEALESPFCDIVRGPFEADDADDAMDILKSII